MLNRFHLILKAGHPARITKILKTEHFDHQFASLDTPKGSFDVVVVTCVDFHDIGVVMEKLSDYTALTTYFVDSNNAIFEYQRIDRAIKPLGYLVGGVKNVPTYNNHLSIGSKTYSFWSAE